MTIATKRTTYPTTPPPRSRAEFVQWLEEWSWSRFVTLATNDPMMKTDRACELIKEWDGRMNRQIVGPQWQKRRCDAIFSFYFLEKSRSNPHWHCLVRFMTWDAGMQDRQTKIFDAKTETIWRKLCSSGTADVQPIKNQRNVEEYVVKALGDTVSYERFVTPDEFWPHL